MRLARITELDSINKFLVDRFWGLEQSSFIAEGLSKPREIIETGSKSELYLYFYKGKIYVYDDVLTGVLVGINTKKLNILNIFFSSLKSNKSLNGISKKDLNLLKHKTKLRQKMHNNNWFKKYSKNAFYITHIAVKKEAKGTGVFRRLITKVIDECEADNLDIVLETYTKENVAIYEHFGFELVETHSCDEIPYVEYCLLKRNNINSTLSKQGNR